MTNNLAEAQTHDLDGQDFLSHHQAIAEAKREQEDAGAALARSKKAAKNAAVDMEAYAFIQKLLKLEPDEAAIRVRHVLQYATYLQMPVGTQFSMLDAPQMPKPPSDAQLAHKVWLAGEAGLKAGREGDASDSNPHPPGSEEHAAWSRKQIDGLAERARIASMGGSEGDAPVADTADATRKAAEGRRQPGGRSRAAKAQRAMDNARQHLTGGQLPN